jgi:hypothetical protein
MQPEEAQLGTQRMFLAEIAIHFPGRENLDRPPILAYPALSVCFDCGFTEMVVAEAELWRLRHDYYSVAAA